MSFHGYELTKDWRNSQCGQVAPAKKGGKSYFLKKYQTPVAPINNGTLDAKTFAHNEKLFNDFVENRKKVNAAIRTVAGSGGNIVIPCDEFIEGNQYVEAAEFVDGAVGDDEVEGVLASLSVDVKKLLMQTAAGALFSIHSKGIVHCDLKLKNVLLVRNKTGNYVAKLIDFDNSFFVDEKPEEIIGTIDYYSPELGELADNEDDREEIAKKVTEKTDIFSLGLIFHYYLAGCLPDAETLTPKLQKRRDKGKIIYCWIVLNSGCQLKISPEIKSAKYASLIRDMLAKNPDDRPTASEVLKRLREAEPVIEEPWPEHSIILDRAKLEAQEIAGLRKITEGIDKKYELIYMDGIRKKVAKEELESMGLVKITAPTGFCEPFPEHGIVFDIDKIRSRGFISSEQKIMGGVKGYQFYRSDSNSMFFKPEMLLAMKYAVKAEGGGYVSPAPAASAAPAYTAPAPAYTAPSPAPAPAYSAPAPAPAYTAPSPAPTPAPAAYTAPAPAPAPVSSAAPVSGGSGEFTLPWAEHSIEFFDPDSIRARGYVRSERAELAGVKGYNFYTADGTCRFIRQEMAVIQRLARKV